MKENDRWLTEAMDHLDPALIEDMDGQATAKRRPAPVRVLLIAACVTGALILGAVAAEMAGIWVSPILPGNELGWVFPSENPEDYSGYVVHGVEGFSWDKVSEELKAEAEKEPELYRVYFNSQAELEAALGFALPYNPVLEAAPEGQGHSRPAGSEEVIHSFGDIEVIIGNNGKATGIAVDTHYIIGNPEHTTHKIYLPISEEDRERGVVESYMTCTGEATVSVRYLGDANSSYMYLYRVRDTELTREDYVTSNGIAAVIIQEVSSSDDHDEIRGYTAHLAVDGMAVTISFRSSNDCVDQEGILKSILDAYPAS